MKFAVKMLSGLVCFLIVGLFLLTPITSQTTAISRRAPQPSAGAPAGESYNFQQTVLGQIMSGVAQTPHQQQGPIVGQPVTPGISPAVRDLVSGESEVFLDREVNPRQNPSILNINPDNPDPYDHGEPDPLLRRVRANPGRTPEVNFTFQGLSINGGVPPDTVGDVGPNHYVQMVNVQFAIFNKSGTMLAGPTNINQLWQGQGNDCENNNQGDPIVLYDRLADRWLLSQFIGNDPGITNGLCFAISQTSDPTGQYFLYQFNTTEFPDYFKVGVWPDAYYVSANEGGVVGYTAYALDRTNMLQGNVARPFIKFTGQNNLLLPSDLDGATPPPAGSPGYFYTFKDVDFHGVPEDRLELFALQADFDTPANSTFNMITALPVTEFTYTVCGFFNLDCIPQPNVAQKLDALSEWPMYRFQYRNFGGHETLVGNFAIDVGTDQSGIRWFELRKSGAGNWTLYQEGTHAPDTDHRWTGSVALDKAGNMALGYSVSSATTFPSIRYATRLAGDPLGTLQQEATLFAGTASQDGVARWGDYSSMNVDPADDCTFWYTNEYIDPNTGSWTTRVGAFKVPSCGAPVGDNFIYLPSLVK